MASLEPIRKMAVDLGTANTMVYVEGKGLLSVLGRDLITQEPLEMNEIRSVVAREKKGKRRLLTAGQAAYDYMGFEEKDEIEILKPIQRGKAVEMEGTQSLLQHAIDEACKGFEMSFSSPWKIPGRDWNLIPDSARLHPPLILTGIPSDPTLSEIDTLKKVIYKVGGIPYIISEPVLAAIALGVVMDKESVEPEKQENSSTVIVDIGGGTTDIAIITFLSRMSKKGFRDHSFPVGGDVYDEAIQRYVSRDRHFLIDLRTAEWIKHKIATAMNCNGVTEVEVPGKILEGGRSGFIKLGWEEIKQSIYQTNQDLARGLRKYFDRLEGATIHGDIARKGIKLTGGGSLIHDLDRFLAEETGQKIFRAPRPLHSVIDGAAIMLQDEKLLKKFNLATAA